MWKYKDKEINKLQELPDHDNIHGFIYRTTHTPSGKMYIGKKSLHSVRNKPLTKKEILAWNKPGRVPKKKQVIQESDWKKYYGSDKWIMSQIKEGKSAEFTREVLQLCYSKKQLTYYEMYHQMLEDVLRSDNYLNDNILGKFFKKDLI